jgi:hypothetical protein
VSIQCPDGDDGRPGRRHPWVAGLARRFGRGRTGRAPLTTAEVRYLWRQACEAGGLARLLYAPSGPTFSVPRIGRVRPGPPTAFTVRLLPGQLPDDVTAAAPRIARAMAASGVSVTVLPDGWLAIELRTGPPTLTVVPPHRGAA